MLRSYLQNSAVSMTKETYFELCEALGSDPIEEEIPVEYEDFPHEVQEAISVYYKLRDEWDTMSGTYMGKSYAGFSDILDILEIPKEDRKYLLDWLAVMDAERCKILADAKPKQAKKTETAL